LTRHLRGLLVAIAALALTAGAVFAAKALPAAPPAAAAGGLSRASEAAGRTVPADGDEPAVVEPDQDADGNADQPGADTEQPDAGAAGDANLATERKQNHGWFVSQAAQGPTPDGFANHGAYVSSIAKGDLGKPGAASAATTGAEKSAAAKAKAAKKSKSHSSH
jgi:hypothetical protein